jgi:hypothetical protein
MDWILDRLLPHYEFRTRYTRQIAAPRDAVWVAVCSVTAEDLPLTRLLTRLRSVGSSRMTGALLDAPPVPELARREGQEIVLGRVAKFWRLRPIRGPRQTGDPAVFTTFAEPGWAKAAMSFQLTPAPGGTLLAIETRVKATDQTSRRLFGAYWTLIRLGGAGFIRLELLRAVALRAEN